MKSVLIDFNGVTIKFSTNFESYQKYFNAYFKQIIPQGGSAEKYDIEIIFDWTEFPLSRLAENVKKQAGVARVGANMFLGEGHVSAVRKIDRRWKILFDVQQVSGALSVNAYFQRKKFKDFFRFGPFSQPAHEFFFNLTYYIFYYPVFWYLASQRGMFPLHASALDLNGKGVVICGLEGIGKTSLGLKFLKDSPGSALLSDNLIFFGQENIYPCYELVRMHAGEKDSLWIKDFERIESLNIRKGFFRPKYLPSRQGIKPEVVIFPEFSQQFSYKRIDGSEAAQRALALSYLPAELNHYVEFRNLYNLLDLNFVPEKVQGQLLEDLLASCRCLRVGMVKEEGLDKNYERVRQLVLS